MPDKEKYELMCLHCAFKAMLAGAAIPPTFDESPEEHMARLHADPEQCWKERQQFEAEMKERFAQHDRN
jgi:hypothetical protein